MGTKLSFSKISSYSLCGQRYYLHYVKGYRDRWQRSSLLFGGAIDKALNNLLATKDLEKSLEIFNKEWSFGWVNKKYVALKDNPNVVYAEKDLDLDLVQLSDEDELWLKEFSDFKKVNQWGDIPEEDRSRYNSIYWDCMAYKAQIILSSYAEKVLPQFLSVTGIQHESSLTNSVGDTIVQYLDFIATLHDGSVVLFDNKTTTSLTYYEDDAPGSSPQLISYYYTNKKKFNLTAVGFVAIQKTLIKNKTKICSKCNFDGSESRAKKCDQEHLGVVVKRGKEVEGLVRCNGDWNVSLNPECAIKVIVNPVTEAAVDLVLASFDEANQSIKNESYYKNLAVCKNIFGSPCTFYKVCWKGDESDIIKLTEE